MSGVKKFQTTAIYLFPTFFLRSKYMSADVAFI